MRYLIKGKKEKRPIENRKSRIWFTVKKSFRKSLIQSKERTHESPVVSCEMSTTRGDKHWYVNKLIQTEWVIQRWRSSRLRKGSTSHNIVVQNVLRVSSVSSV